MFNNRQLWTAIDKLAERQGLTASGLARRAGLDSTAFNRSKRTTPDGRERWPTTESLSKILDATSVSFDEFAALLEQGRDFPPSSRRLVPLIGFAQAGGGGFFDDAGFPTGGGWEEIAFPGIRDDNAYALEVSGDSMAPLFRDGDIIIVSPSSSLRRGDRVVVKTRDGEVMAKCLQRQTANTIELTSLNPEHKPRSFAVNEIDWIARILWVSQ